MMYETDENQHKKVSPPHIIYNYVMGFLWTGLGIFIIFHKQFNYDLGRLRNDPVLTSIFGGAAILYGLFRLYRAVTKKR